MAEFFAEYDAFGERRAGGSGDAVAAGRLREQAARAGMAARLEVVAFTRFTPGEAVLHVSGHSITGLPLFDGGVTGPLGFRGTLGPLGSAAAIGFAEMDPAAASLPNNAFAKARSESQHQGIVIALRTKQDGLAPLNAHDAETPFGPPVLQVAGRDAARLAALAAEGAQARLVVHGTRSTGTSHNVRADMPGQEPPLVLLTPRTSWWTSTAERAGGILAWLTALRALAVDAGGTRVVALATCGHELGHLGAHHAFTAEPMLVPGARLVVHLGANLGTAEAPRLVVRSNRDGLADQMARMLAEAGYPADAIISLTGGKANGEAHEIEARGGGYLSLIGTNPWFHAPEDRWPHSVDVPRATAIAEAVARMAVRLARADALPAA